MESFLEWSSLLHITILPGLLAIAIAVVEINVFNLSRDLIWPRVQRVVWLNGFKFLIVSHHFVKLPFQDHLIKGSGDFIEENSSFFIYIQTKLIVIDIVVMDI